MTELLIPEKTSEPVVNVALHTIENKKQALVFVNAKRSAEKVAEDIAKKISSQNSEHLEIAEKIVNVLSKPTKQCERLSLCVKKGIAFHHSGLASKQRELIEENFRRGVIKIICCTPTLCLSGDTKLWGGCDELKVSEVSSSKKINVLSKNNIIELPFERIEKLHNLLPLLEISSVSGHSIKVTPEHKLLIKRGNEKKIICAKYVKKSDKIASIGKLSITKIKSPKISDFVVDNELPISDKDLDELFFYFIGAMLGDGYSGAETRNGVIKYKGSPCIVGKDEEIFERVAGVCSVLKISCRRINNFNGTPCLILGKNKWFREFLCRCGIEKGKMKYIESGLLTSSEQNISLLLKGLFDTDGYVQKGRNIGISSISEVLIKQIQKLLLRFGIVSRIRKRNAGTIEIYSKKYKTSEYYELLVSENSSILKFCKKVGFEVKRKQKELLKIVSRIESNVHYFLCGRCNYKLYRDIFSGRTKKQKLWGDIKYKIIKLLAEKKELSSKDLTCILGFLPRKNEKRLNHHYELIKKRRIGSRSTTDYFWSLNKIGNFIYDEFVKKDKSIEQFFNLELCPLCSTRFDKILKRGWRANDFEGDIFWDLIRKIKRVLSEPYVYDVVISDKCENDHMFVANGFIVHNSAGVDLPAFRSIIRDVKRYSERRGMDYIPVLEYLQMAGRAGRPKFDDRGEAIIISSSEAEKDFAHENYILGEPEAIYSKLSVEPVLRTYILSLISSKIVQSKEQIEDFFSKTFWAHQYKDLGELFNKIEKMLKLLTKWEFIESQGDKYEATYVGRRVAELYVDPLTADKLTASVKRAGAMSNLKSISLIHAVCNTLEMRPLLNVKTKEYDLILEESNKLEGELIDLQPSMFESEYDEWLSAFKTAMMLNDWMEENDEEYLLEKYDVRPGELHNKIENADWLLFSCYEFARINQLQPLLKEISKARYRLKYGVKEELLTLLKLDGVGRVRARKMFKAGIKDLGDVKKVSLEVLNTILGKQVAINVKKQVGEKMDGSLGEW